MSPTKICGIKDLSALQAAIQFGARYVGFVFYPESARAVSVDQARILCRHIPTGVKAVGLFVNPTNEELDRIATTVQLDMIQLHGDETPGRAAEIKEKYSLQVMKAIRVASADDLAEVAAYESAVDWLLFDAKAEASRPTPPPSLREEVRSPPLNPVEYGGTGNSFDWTILKNKTFKKPWMLAGGINIDNIKEALSILSPDAVDISSGVEHEKGVKDPQKIKDFLDFMREIGQ